MTEKNTDTYPLHAIQLVGIKILELSIVVNPDIITENARTDFDGAGPFSWNIGHSDYDHERKGIVVKAIINMGEEEKSPFKLKIEMAGIFEVDESRFPLIHIEHWASNNAPLVLYPYLRELAYGLTTRAGFPGVLLPLLQVPTFKINKNIDNTLAQKSKTKSTS